MTGIDIFALFVLLVIAVTLVVIWVKLSMLPGKIARERGHPQSAAINACGWFGGLTMGLLWPLAFIWAYMRPPTVLIPEDGTSPGESTAMAALRETAATR